MNCDLTKHMPPMLAGEELLRAMTILPDYDAAVCSKPASDRLIELSNLYQLYIPSPMSLEIYSKLYLALMRSLRKKTNRAVILQKYENLKATKQQDYEGIIGGSDSFTIIGVSGIGKSSAISRSLTLIAGNGVIELEQPYSKIIPYVVVQCPFDSSVKGLLLEILRKVDDQLESNYYRNALKVKATVDMLIGSVSQVALNHIGLLVVDEIQNVVNSKTGKQLIGMLTQLINNSGISICMVGTPESTVFFEQALQLARRSLGLQYGKLEYDAYFCDFCRSAYEYQYVRNKASITPATIEWLYAHSSGVISVVVSLIHDAQEIAILNGTDELNQAALNEAYQKRLAMLHSYIQPPPVKRPSAAPMRKQVRAVQKPVIESVSIEELAAKAKAEKLDMVALLKEHIPVDEVKL